MELPESEADSITEANSSTPSLELTSHDEQQPQQQPANNLDQPVRASDSLPKNDLYRARVTSLSHSRRFLLENNQLSHYYRQFPQGPTAAKNNYSFAQESPSRMPAPPRAPREQEREISQPQLASRPITSERESSRCIEMPMPPPSQKNQPDLPPKPTVKPQRKKEKTRLKNLEKYKNIEISSGAQDLNKLKERAVEQKLQREYGNIFKRQKTGETSKMTDQQIKVWLKKDSSKAPVEQQLALSFINSHVNNYAPLLKVVLGYSFAQDLLEQECKKIPTTFADKETYEKVFQFLIFNETIASLHNKYHSYSKEDNCKRPMKALLKPGNVNEDGFFTFTLKQQNEDPNQAPQHAIKNISLSKFNLVLVSSSPLFDAKCYSTRDFSKGFLFMGCLLAPENKEQLSADPRIITAVNGNEFTKRFGSQWTSAYVFNFQKASTFVREFLAVRNVQLVDLAQYIYNPPLMTHSDPTYVKRPEIFNRFFERMQTIFNKTQLRSIKQLCLRDRGIIMLQGPPGTGKTSTLLGVLAGQYYYLQALGQLGSTKILVCTPSNTAIDHIVKRVVGQGLISEDHQHIKPKVLRVGFVETTDPVVRSVYLDYLCEKELIDQNEKLTQQVKWTIPQMKDKITDIMKEMIKIENALRRSSSTANSASNKELNDKLKKLMMSKRELEDRVYLLRRKRVGDKSRFNQIQKRLVNEAEIIFTTLSSAGSDRLDKYKGQFACLIVDEAGQCTEPNLLIALQLNIPKVLLIGDPYQLPATTFSPDSNVTLFNRSMFERMIDGGLRPYFLDIQYRMTSQIRYFPSKRFYNGRLTDDFSVRSREYPHEIRNFARSNLAFIDVRYGQDRRVDSSYYNEAEIGITTSLIELLRAQKLSIGVITPYKQQMHRLRSALKQCGNVFINTIDSFQGQEKDIVLISCVRSSNKFSKNSLGFLIDQRRINVALTRSKFLLLVIGNADTLGSNEVWDDFLQYVVKQNQYMRINQEKHAQSTLKRLLQGDLTPDDRLCERTKHNTLSKDVRKSDRDEIDLGDFAENAPDNIPPVSQVPVTSASQPLTYEKTVQAAPASAAVPVTQDKWSVQAAGSKDIEKTLNAMYGDRSFFELLRDMK